MTQLLDRVELSIATDSSGKTHHWLGPVITEPSGRVVHAPDYMTHFPDPRLRQERQKLQEIIADLNPLSGSLPQPRNS